MAHGILRCITAFSCCFLSTLALASPLQLNLSVGAVDGTVNVKLVNTSRQTLSILQWDTPFESTLSHDVFLVTSSTKALPFFDAAPYIGRHPKRATPLAEHYITLQPGRSISATVDLAEYYDIQEQSLYRVRFAGGIRYTSISKKSNKYSDKKIIAPLSKVSSLEQTGFISNEVSVALSPNVSSRILTPAYNGCTADQQAYIQSATQSAETLTEVAVNDLQSLAAGERATSPRYTTWFGSYTEQRYNRVLENFQAIGGALANETIRYDCTCNESGIFAYVYPVRPYNIFLCNEFHAADELGTDSRAGTIIHELSHFTVVAGTDDHVYSQQGAQSLAVSDPARAIENADSHEYFAENTPELPIRSNGSSPPEIQFTQLALNAATSGEVIEGSSDYYQIDNAESVTLTTLSGDADLYIFSDTSLSQSICISQNTALEVDRCEVFYEDTLYVSVFGYEDSEYTILVTGQSSAPPVDISVLTVDSPVSGFIAQDERIVYQVSGVDIVNLESITGDADLFIFSSTDYSTDTLVCSSLTRASENNLDSCNLPEPSNTYYVMVVGWLDADYQLTATVTDVDTTPEITLTSFGNLPADQQVSRSVAERAIHTYTATGIEIFELTSLTGDADLIVFDGLIASGGDAICVSEEFSSVSTLDRCNVSANAGNLLEVAVFGFTASDYTLLGRSGNGGTETPPETETPPGTGTPPETETPPETGTPPVTVSPPDDEPVTGDPVAPTNPTTPTPVLPTSSSGGGSMGMIALLAGFALVVMRQRRRLVIQP